MRLGAQFPRPQMRAEDPLVLPVGLSSNGTTGPSLMIKGSQTIHLMSINQTNESPALPKISCIFVRCHRGSSDPMEIHLCQANNGTTRSFTDKGPQTRYLITLQHNPASHLRCLHQGSLLAITKDSKTGWKSTHWPSTTAGHLRSAHPPLPPHNSLGILASPSTAVSSPAPFTANYNG